jgi:tetratricopeptide (TPR) repeat protein
MNEKIQYFLSRNKKIIILFLLLLLLSFGIFAGFFFVKNLTIQNENIEIKESLIDNYTRDIFVLGILNKQNVVYNKDKLKEHILLNYDNFLVAINLDTSISNYLKNYQISFKVLGRLKSIAKISSKNYLEFKKMLSRFEFSKLQSSLRYVNLKNNGADVVAYKNYFEGIVAELNFDKESAKDFYKQSIKLNPYKSDCYLSLGNIFVNQYRFDLAIDVYKAALNNSTWLTRNDTGKKLELMLNLGHAHAMIEDNKLALDTYNDLLVHSLLANNKIYEYLAIYNIGIIESRNHNYKSAIETMLYALKLSTKLGNEWFKLETLIKLADYNYTYGNYEVAKFYGLRSVLLSKQLKDMGGIANSSILICMSYDFLQKEELSKLYCNRAIKINNTLMKVIGRPEQSLQNGIVFERFNFLKETGKGKDYIRYAYNLSKKFDLKLVEMHSLKVMFLTDFNKEKFFDYITYRKKIGVKDDCCQFYNYVLVTLLSGNKFEAVKQANERLKYSDNPLEIALISSLLSDYYRDAKNISEAIKYGKISLKNYQQIYKNTNVFFVKQKQSLNNLIKNATNKNGN